MKKQTKTITLGAVFTALSVIFIYISVFVPTGQLGFLALASLFGIAAVIEAGISCGILVYAATAILGFLLIPDKASMILYAAFFGYYPVLKSLAEKIKNRVAEMAVKLVVLNIALTAIIVLFSVMMFDLNILGGNKVLIYIAANVVFVIFDFGVSKVIDFYLNRISRRMKH